MRARFDRRGVFLLAVGVVWIVNGIQLVTDPSIYHTGRGLDLLGHVAGGLPFAVAWFVTGVVAVVCAWLPRSNTLGYTLVVIMPVVRALTYLAAFAYWLQPGGAPGDSHGLVAAVIWALIACIILIVAGWRAPPANTA